MGNVCKLGQVGSASGVIQTRKNASASALASTWADNTRQSWIPPQAGRMVGLLLLTSTPSFLVSVLKLFAVITTGFLPTKAGAGLIIGIKQPGRVYPLHSSRLDLAYLEQSTLSVSCCSRISMCSDLDPTSITTIFILLQTTCLLSERGYTDINMLRALQIKIVHEYERKQSWN